MSNKVFEQIWNQLRAKKAQLSNFLDGVTIKNLRGINQLSVRFNYPVTVLSGPNGSGKTTILFSCACAYSNKANNYSPATIFPNLKARTNHELNDKDSKPSFEFDYLIQDTRKSMIWSQGKSWNKSYRGEKNGTQPYRPFYLRTLANLTSPSEIRSYLKITQINYDNVSVTSDQIALAQRIMSYRYTNVTLLKKNEKELLFVERNDNVSYSEFHMSAGERAILRLSKDISMYEDALILIDEVEAGLHPLTQQQLMLELQRLALRNNLQIIVTSHSPVVLNAVPPEARIFLDRTPDGVKIQPAYLSIIQKALYGQSIDKLSILCEDDIAKAFIVGVLDVLNPKLDIMPDDVVVGRDTGKDEFPNHILAIGKFNKLDDFIFVFDGDAKNTPIEQKTKEIGLTKFHKTIEPLFLPGLVPEDFIFNSLKRNPNEYEKLLGISENQLLPLISQIDLLYETASDKKSNILKNKFATLCERFKRTPKELSRLVASNETQKNDVDVYDFVSKLEEQIRRWQIIN